MRTAAQEVPRDCPSPRVQPTGVAAKAARHLGASTALANGASHTATGVSGFVTLLPPPWSQPHEVCPLCPNFFLVFQHQRIIDTGEGPQTLAW